jgi:regulator of protease activity HflC (stomatin/prohibitin superfamily)
MSSHGKNAFLYGISGIVLLFTVIVLWPFTSVPTGYRGVITQFGAIKSIENEGFKFILPWEKLTIFSIRAETVKIEGVEGATADTQPVHVSLVVRYAIQPDKVSSIFEQYSHTGDLSSYVDTATHEVFKAVTARYTAPDLVGKRQEVSEAILRALGSKITPYGANVLNIDMTGFAFSKQYMDAIMEKVTQEQKKLAADNKLKTVESEQRQVVAIAEAERDAQKARADGTAYTKKTLASAEADAIRYQGEALKQSADVLDLRRIEVERVKAEKWNGQLPSSIYAGAPVPFMNVLK